MKNRSSSPTIVNLSEFAFKKDKRIASVELRDYFVGKNRQEKGWQLMAAVKNSIRQNIFSIAEVKKITEFLARKYELRLPALEFSLALNPSTFPRKSNRDNRRTDLVRRQQDSNENFYQLFMRLQTGVQENLLDYNGARVLVEEIITQYPKAKEFLRR